MKPLAIAAAGIGSGTAVAIGLTSGELAAVTGISCMFGMLSSASRLVDAPISKIARTVLMNGGAAWIASFSLASAWHANLSTAALIGLGVGLAGSRALELIESSVLRAMGKQPVTKEEVATMLGDLRNDTQAAVSDINVRTRKRLREREEESDDD